MDLRYAVEVTKPMNGLWAKEVVGLYADVRNAKAHVELIWPSLPFTSYLAIREVRMIESRGEQS